MSDETIPVLFRVRLPDGLVGAARFEIQVRTGDEGFRVMEQFKKCHGPTERDAEADRRFLELKARIARGEI